MDTTARKNITASLYSGDDQDLIAWVNSLPPKSNVSDEIKAVLRRGLDLPPPDESALEERIAQRIEQEISAALDRFMGQYSEPAPQPDDSAQLAHIARILDEIQRQHEADMNALADQLNEQHAAALAALERKVNERVNELALTGTVQPTDEIEPAPRLDDSALNNRKQKMKKATW